MLRGMTDLLVDCLKFAKEMKLKEVKMACFLELTMYMLKQLVLKKINEEESF
jgi:hypothetical protein